MQPAPYKQEPLTDDDRSLLLAVYNARRRIILPASIFLMLLALYAGQKSIDRYDKYSGKVYSRWEEDEDAKYVGRKAMYIIKFSFLAVPLASCFLFIWYKKLRPITQDINAGVKDVIPYQIIRKEYFPLTGRFYVALDDPNYLHHEIDEETYYNCTEGGFIYVYRAPKSKFIFEESGHFVIL